MDNKEFLGIIFKASSKGLIKAGDYTCGAALSSGETELIVIAKDSKSGIKTKFGQLGFRYDVEVITTGTSREGVRCRGEEKASL